MFSCRRENSSLDFHDREKMPPLLSSGFDGSVCVRAVNFL